MKRLITFALLLGMFTLLAGCYKHTYTVGDGAPPGSKVVYQHWHHHWIAGLIGEERMIIDELCPSGNAVIHEERSFLNGLVDVLTFSIYSPTEVTVICAEGGRETVKLSSDTVARIVTDPRFLIAVEEIAPERLADATLARRHLEFGHETRVAALH